MKINKPSLSIRTTVMSPHKRKEAHCKWVYIWYVFFVEFVVFLRSFVAIGKYKSAML